MAIVDEFTLVVIAATGCVCVAAAITGTLTAVRKFRKESSSNYGIGDYIEYLRQSKKTLVLFLLGLVLFFVSVSFFLLS